jgi:hypothetical protein
LECTDESCIEGDRLSSWVRKGRNVEEEEERDERDDV